MFYLAKLVLNIASKASDICIAKSFIKKTCEKIAWSLSIPNLLETWVVEQDLIFKIIEK